MVMEEQQSDIELDSERVPVPQVQKSMEESHVETVNKVIGVGRGKPRLRKKALHAAIVKQMEFYFSDANLNKDRFLSCMVKEDPYVDLNIFIRFNKIRELTTDINRLNKALQQSTMLSLSEDGLKVRRITPVVIKENADECTVYVQNLPPDADHETLKQIFSQYGLVEYVSVPKYKSNKKIKGFAFIEFNTPDCAKNCLKAFQKKGCVLPSHTPPNELLSIMTFDDEEKDVTRGMLKNENKESTNSTEESNTNEETEKSEETDNNNELNESKDTKKAKKRRHKDTVSVEAIDAENQTDNEIIKNKKKKSKNSSDVSDDETEQISEKQIHTSADGTPKKSSQSKKSLCINEEEQVLENVDESDKMIVEDSTNDTAEEQGNTDEKKKKRKRKKRSKMEDVSYSLGLQVMAKKDWKHLRNKYLELQKSKMKQLKQHLRKTRWNQWSNYEKNKSEKEEHDDKDKTEKQDNTSACRFSFTPGVIVKIEMGKPCSDPKSFKMDLRGNNSLKYIDIEEGSCVAYVRCDTADAAQTFAQKSDEERHMSVLEGEEEKMYWDKILRDRDQKIGNKVRVKQRGRNKLLKKAEKELGKHIKFDEV